MTAILDNAISPSEAVAKLQKAGINISERTLRERARQLGACRVIGKTMFLMPIDIDTIVNAAKPEPKCQNSTSEKAAQTGTTTSRSMGYDTEDLLKRLTSGSRKTSRQRPNHGSVVPLSTVKKPS